MIQSTGLFEVILSTHQPKQHYYLYNKTCQSSQSLLLSNNTRCCHTFYYSKYSSGLVYFCILTHLKVLVQVLRTTTHPKWIDMVIFVASHHAMSIIHCKTRWKSIVCCLLPRDSVSWRL